MSCPFKDVFGKPNEGVHSYRLFGVAIVDVISTVVGVVLIAWFLNVSWWKTLIVAFVLGEIMHYIFGVQTAVLTFLGIRACSSSASTAPPF
jgi:hypothetical protein